jgi:mandelate racemase
MAATKEFPPDPTTRQDHHEVPMETAHAAPRIRGLKATPIRLPMSQPHRTASGVVAESPLVLVDVLTEEGVTGYGLVFTYTAAALGPTAELVRNLEPLVRDEPVAPAELAQRLARRFRLVGTQGLVGMALAGLDMALWDALARCHRTSLVRLLGGVERPIPAYGAVGHDGVEGSTRVAAEWAERGFKGVKAKIGYPTVQEDLAVVRAIRKAVGDEVAIMVDYNQSLSPPQAVERIRALEDEGLAWVEEPTLAHDYAGHALIASEVRTPIQCGENWWGPLDMQHAIDARASDYMMPDVMKIGGVTGWLQAAALAQPRGIPLSSHLWPELSAQLLCVTPTAHWLEYSDWWSPVLGEPIAVKDGMADPAGALGTGVSWDDDVIRRLS